MHRELTGFDWNGECVSVCEMFDLKIEMMKILIIDEISVLFRIHSRMQYYSELG